MPRGASTPSSEIHFVTVREVQPMSPESEILMGSEKQQFFVHAKLVARQSVALASLVQGGMTEAKERCAFLEDVDARTFTPFAESAYTGD